MTLQAWLSMMPEAAQTEVWKKLLHHLSNREIMKVIEEAKKNRDLYEIHRELGLLEKYRGDLCRIIDSIHMQN